MTMVVPRKRREFDGFYVLYTAVAEMAAKGNKVERFVVPLILAESARGSQWGIGQKGIDMANLDDRQDAQRQCPAQAGH
ncbi:hypothetical protein J3P75_11315 [Pseudomonas sp. R1-1]|uniref:hypothetical protein n=1 Tax=Pseudomonas sp. R1-1 TaxID=1602529 RepID=UPI003DA94D1C